MSDTDDRLQQARSVTDQSADLMSRVQSGEITAEQAWAELNANPAADNFRIG